MPDLRARLVALLYEHQEGATANLNLGRDGATYEKLLAAADAAEAVTDA